MAAPGVRGKYRSYSPDEKASFLLKLALNGGDLRKTARETGIPVSTLKTWRDDDFRDFLLAQSEEAKTFIGNAWKAMNRLVEPDLISALIEKAKEEKGGAKAIASLLGTITDKVATLARAQSRMVPPEGKGKEEGKEPEETEAELQKMIKEEKEKQAAEKKQEETVPQITK